MKFDSVYRDVCTMSRETKCAMQIASRPSIEEVHVVGVDVRKGFIGVVPVDSTAGKQEDIKYYPPSQIFDSRAAALEYLTEWAAKQVEQLTTETP